jgi:hypothetical protein
VAPRRLPTWFPWLLFGLTLPMLAVGGWIRATGRGAVPVQPWGWLEELLVGLVSAGIAFVGALLASRLPDNPYGWIWCAIGLGIGISGVARPLVQAVDGPLWVTGYVEGYAYAAFPALFVLAILLFPTGRPPGPRWRWLARAAVVASLLLMFVGPFIPDSDVPSPWAVRGAAARYLLLGARVWVLVMFVFGLAAVWALLLRYRRAGPVERQQLTWFLDAALLAVPVLVLNALGLMPWRPLAVVLQGASLALFPAAVAVAVLRYRLYDLDRIMSRTVTYGLLTGAIFAVYLLVVAVLAQVGLPRRSSDAVVAAVTLAVAALVGRVRRRLQTAVDRRFDRGRYDADRAVAAFAARLRDEVDLDQVVGGLRNAVGATVAPRHMTVWLRRTERG